MKENSTAKAYTAKKLAEYLREAASLSQPGIRDENPFKFLGFDRSAGRLGWARKLEYSKIEEEAQRFLSLIDARKKKFLFLGMGGSINGIKVAQKIFSVKNILPWDSLDFSLFSDPSSKEFFEDPASIQVISLSKSGTTDETHLITNTFHSWLQESSLWGVDPSSLPKLQAALNTSEVRAFSLQFDKHDDIGGRFSSPTTTVFLLPLFLSKKARLVSGYWEKFLGQREEIMLKAAEQALSFKEKKNAYFSVVLPARYAEVLETWVTQLFQESLGSKKEGFLVKTLLSEKGASEQPAGFDTLDASSYGEDPGDIFGLLFYLQCFVAFFACVKEINFVNQDYVEEYKRVLKELKKSAECAVPAAVTLLALKEQIEQKVAANSAVQFIEAVYYGHLNGQQIRSFRQTLQKWFPRQKVFLFLGSDWNHHSYQAAFKANDTYFPVIMPQAYHLPYGRFSKESLDRCIVLLRQIACATQKTLAARSGLFCLKADSGL